MNTSLSPIPFSSLKDNLYPQFLFSIDIINLSISREISLSDLPNYLPIHQHVPNARLVQNLRALR